MFKFCIYLFIYLFPFFALAEDGNTGMDFPDCSNKVWQSPRIVKSLSEISKLASIYSSAILESWSDREYLEYSINGSRINGEKMMGRRIDPLSSLVLTECLENSGRFIHAIERTLDGLSLQPSWTLPAHDLDLANLRGDYSVDLNACEVAHDAAWALKLIGFKIKPEVRERVINSLHSRVFMPLRRAIDARNRGKTFGREWWIGAASNWNAVCISGVVGAAYAMGLDDLNYWLNFGRTQSQHYLDSFKSDGYSDEGPSYWNYGYGAYLRLRETLLLAQPNDVDLLSNPKARIIANYPNLISFPSGSVAPFGDAPQQTRIDAVLKIHAEVAVGLAATDAWKYLVNKIPPKSRLNEAVWRLWGNPKAAPGFIQPHLNVACSFFPIGGVAIFKPATVGDCQDCLSVALRTGGSKRHSHDDAGSYAIDINGVIIAGDPGAPVYTKDTFGSDRRKNSYINSYGHPVPYINKTKQLDGTLFQAKWVYEPCLMNKKSTSIDLLPVYQISGLSMLQRDVNYEDELGGVVGFKDSFESIYAIKFETAIITRGIVAQDHDGILVKHLGKKIKIKIMASNSFDVSYEPLRDDLNQCVTRIALGLRENSIKGFISYSYQAIDDRDDIIFSEICEN